jgi:hypothetical protein
MKLILAHTLGLFGLGSAEFAFRGGTLVGVEDMPLTIAHPSNS